MSHRIVRNLDPIIAIGVILSVALSIVLVLIGQDEAMSLLIGLVGIAITLLIDIIGRQIDAEHRSAETLQLSKVLFTSPYLFRTIRGVAQDFEVIQKSKFSLFSQRADDALLEFREIIHGIAEGRITSPLGSKFTYGVTGFASAKRSVKTVAYADPGYWRTTTASMYLKQNFAIAHAGVRFIRIWAYDDATIQLYRDVIEQQVQGGIEVHIVNPDKVPPELLDDYMIVDDRVLVRLNMNSQKHGVSETISTNALEIDRAELNFDLLLRHAIAFDAYFTP